MFTVYKIEAIIRPQRLEGVQEALHELGLNGLTVTEVRGTGRSKGVSHSFRGSQYANNLGQRIKVEVVASAELLDEALEAIVDAAQTGEAGDGNIYVHALHSIVRIRTNERNEAAL